MRRKTRRRGGNHNYTLNLRNCQRYYHPWPSRKCTEAMPESSYPRYQIIDYPGITGLYRKPTFLMNSYPHLMGQRVPRELI